MIYLITNEIDVSTQDLIYWLNYYNKDYKTLYLDNKIFNFHLELSNSIKELEIDVDNHRYKINLQNDVFFYRRGEFQFLTGFNLNLINNTYVKNFLNNESRTVKYFIENVFYNISNIKTRNELNKLEVLNKAVDLGIRIPNSAVITKKDKLLEFYNDNSGKVIVKPIYEGINVKQGNGFLKSYTSRITKEDIEGFCDSFHPTLFQNEISKTVDVRTFYLKGQFFSMAIFSQGNQETEVDFRNYDKKNKLITTPFKLPDELEKKLDKLFIYLSIETGSIDLCLSMKYDLYFLEINPVGQYGMLYNCNYQLNKKIAKIL